ncbi:cytochrome c oxidase assembly protein CtaG/Cox11-domain-containing protein [Limtongia smithiae]|uniref:cytochrome c oxidase assembly protein CtaG/Cox11-domain-containing protein n=1 Tax=Limtongia smithiae TaxID=1125753 RepID=UPI0034CE0B23
MQRIFARAVFGSTRIRTLQPLLSLSRHILRSPMSSSCVRRASIDPSKLNPAFLKQLESMGLTVDEFIAQYKAEQRLKNLTTLNYGLSVLIGTLALSYASVPFYRLLCQKTGWGGTPMTDSDFAPDRVIPVNSDRKITVYFASDVSRTLPWSFEPLQKSVTVAPGETALAFFKAKSKAKEDIVGVATYNVSPQQIAPYFNKIQCFCFEQQQLRAGEEVDMPIFFFIDPDFDSDPLMKNIHEVTLSYTFFRSKSAAVGPVLVQTDARLPLPAEIATSSTQT